MWETVEKEELLSLSFLGFWAELSLTAGACRLPPTPRLPPLPLCSLLSEQRLYTEKGTFLYFGCELLFLKLHPPNIFPHPCLFFSLDRRCTTFFKKGTVYQEKPTRGLHAPATAKGSFDVITNSTPGSNGVASKGPLSFS